MNDLANLNAAVALKAQIAAEQRAERAVRQASQRRLDALRADMTTVLRAEAKLAGRGPRQTSVEDRVAFDAALDRLLSGTVTSLLARGGPSESPGTNTPKETNP